MIFYSMDPDPLLRSSFWMVSVGLTSMWVLIKCAKYDLSFLEYIFAIFDKICYGNVLINL